MRLSALKGGKVLYSLESNLSCTKSHVANKYEVGLKGKMSKGGCAPQFVAQVAESSSQEETRLANDVFGYHSKVTKPNRSIKRQSAP